MLDRPNLVYCDLKVKTELYIMISIFCNIFSRRYASFHFCPLYQNVLRIISLLKKYFYFTQFIRTLHFASIFLFSIVILPFLFSFCFLNILRFFFFFFYLTSCLFLFPLCLMLHNIVYLWSISKRFPINFLFLNSKEYLKWTFS